MLLLCCLQVGAGHLQVPRCSLLAARAEHEQVNWQVLLSLLAEAVQEARPGLADLFADLLRVSFGLLDGLIRHLAKLRKDLITHGLLAALPNSLGSYWSWLGSASREDGLLTLLMLLVGLR